MAATFLDLYDLFIFDLDGTLADTREDIASSLNRALAAVGAPPLGLDAVARLVGYGARVLIEKSLGPGASPESVDRALEVFLADYAEECVRRTRLYPGVEETLGALGRAGKRLAVLTNKPILPALKILRALGAAKHFDRIEGGDTAPRKKPDPAGLIAIIDASGVPAERALLVGDSAVDTATARGAGARSAWVPYGFEREEPAEPPPDHVLPSFQGLLARAVRRG